MEDSTKTWADRTTGRLDIEQAVAAKLGVKQEAVGDVLCEVLNEIASALARGNRVVLRRWAVLTPKVRPGKRMHDVNTGEIVRIPARTNVKFKASPALLERVQPEVA